MHTSSPAAEPIIRLPRVRPEEVEEVYSELERMGADLPRFDVILSGREARRAHTELMKGSGPISHAEVLALVVPIVESLFDDEVSEYGVRFHVQLMMMCAYPSIPEALALQTAFGRSVGEEQLTKIVRLSDRAHRRGMSVDECVERLRSQDAVPHDRLFLGESVRAPSDRRLRRAVALLRRTAALSPGPSGTPVLCAIAWMLWARGRRAIALAYLAEALRLEPDSILARGLTLHFREHTPAWIADPGASS